MRIFAFFGVIVSHSEGAFDSIVLSVANGLDFDASGQTPRPNNLKVEIFKQFN